MIAVTAPMLQSFAALLLAHVLADFVFQFNWMIERKRQFGVFLLHIVIVAVLSLAALGGAWQLALLVAGAHLAVDAIKTYALPDGMRATFGAFMADQIAHLATIIAAVLWWPGAAAAGLWAGWLPLLLVPALILSGFILTVRAGGHAVGLITAPYAQEFKKQGLPKAGQMIGQLERAVIFLLILIGQPTGIGFLIAAKSLLRFEATKEQRASEYVIIGTLTSFGWALAISSATVALIGLAGRVG